MGIPALHALRTDAACAKASAVWPFETGLSAERLEPQGLSREQRQAIEQEEGWILGA